MIHINSAFEKSSRFIDVEKVQKESVHVIDDFFAKQHNANKVWHSETQAFVEKSIWYYLQIQQTNRHNDDSTY